MSSCLCLRSVSFCPSFLFLCTYPCLLPLCMYICLPAFCLCPRSCGIVTKCWLHTWQATLPACLAFWGFQALRIPLPGFLSLPPPPLSLLSSSVFSSLLPFPRVEPVVLYRFVRVWSVNRNCWLLASAGITERLVARFSRLCLVTTLALSLPLSLANRVLYHQLYRASSHWVECDKNPILLWFKWINIPSACLFCAWLRGRIDRVKLVIYSARFSCKTGMHLACILLVYDECHGAILIMFSPLVFIKDAKESKWKMKALSLCFPPFQCTPNERAKIRLCLVVHILLTSWANGAS